MELYIPTLGRVDRQVTLKNMPVNIQKAVMLVVHPTEVQAHRAAGVVAQLLPCPAQGKGIGPVRDWILDHATKAGTKRFAMLDDDIILQKRRGLRTAPGGRRYHTITNATPEEYVQALAWVDGALKVHAHASWGTRFLDIETTDKELRGGRAMGLLGYNVAKVNAAGARFGKGLEGTRGGMEDNNMTLQLLTAGYANAVSMVWRCTSPGSQARGGCQTWRTAATIEEQARRIAELHAPFAKLRVKKSVWAGVEGTQYDVTIQWKKALAFGESK